MYVCLYVVKLSFGGLRLRFASTGKHAHESFVSLELCWHSLYNFRRSAAAPLSFLFSLTIRGNYRNEHVGIMSM